MKDQDNIRKFIAPRAQGGSLDCIQRLSFSHRRSIRHETQMGKKWLPSISNQSNRKTGLEMVWFWSGNWANIADASALAGTTIEKSLNCVRNSKVFGKS
jgi:hypothetical protein